MADRELNAEGGRTFSAAEVAAAAQGVDDLLTGLGLRILSAGSTALEKDSDLECTEELLLKQWLKDQQGC